MILIDQFLCYIFRFSFRTTHILLSTPISLKREAYTFRPEMFVVYAMRRVRLMLMLKNQVNPMSFHIEIKTKYIFFLQQIIFVHNHFLP